MTYLVVLVQALGVEDPVPVVTNDFEYPDAPDNVRHHPGNSEQFVILGDFDF